MPRLAEIAKEVRGLKATRTPQNKEYVKRVITQPECKKILIARGLGLKLSKMLGQNMQPWYFAESLLEELKKEILDTIRVIFSKLTAPDNPEVRSRLLALLHEDKDSEADNSGADGTSCGDKKPGDPMSPLIPCRRCSHVADSTMSPLIPCRAYFHVAPAFHRRDHRP